MPQKYSASKEAVLLHNSKRRLAMKKKFDVKKALIIIAAVIILWPLLRTVFTIGAIVAMAIFVYLLVTGAMK